MARAMFYYVSISLLRISICIRNVIVANIYVYSLYIQCQLRNSFIHIDKHFFHRDPENFATKKQISRKRSNKRSDNVYFSYYLVYTFFITRRIIETCRENRKIKLPNDAYFPFIFTRHARQTLLRNGRAPNLQFSQKYTQYMNSNVETDYVTRRISFKSSHSSRSYVHNYHRVAIILKE